MRILVTHDGQTNLYTQSDIARAVDLTLTAIWNRVRLYGTLPEPNVKVGARLYYSENDYNVIVAALATEKQARVLARK